MKLARVEVCCERLIGQLNKGVDRRCRNIWTWLRGTTETKNQGKLRHRCTRAILQEVIEGVNMSFRRFGRVRMGKQGRTVISQACGDVVRRVTLPEMNPEHLGEHTALQIVGSS